MKAVLFDLDGVLVDACEWHYEALNKALKETSNITIGRQEHFSTFNGLPSKKKLDILYEQNRVKQEDFDKIFELKQQYTIDTIKHGCFQNKTKIKLCKMLKQEGYKLGCVTNSIKITANLMLELTGILDLMDIVITNEDCKHNKPHPEPYIKTLVLLQSLPENSYIVEDSPKGIQAANLTGCKVIEVQNAHEVNLNLLSELK